MHTMVFLDAATMGDADLSALQQQNATLVCHSHTLAADIVPRLQHATIAIVNKAELTADILQQLPALKLICVAATGVNNVDLTAAAALGITVCNVRGYADTAVPQHVFALLLQLTNQVQQYHQAVQRGDWQRSRHFCLLDYPVTELAGKCFVVIGYGALGKATAGLAAAFGMQVVIAEQPGAAICREGRVVFNDALAQADVISLHCPLTADTEHLFNRHTFAMVKRGALLLNTARGGLVDAAALLNALQSGQLAGAALDVLQQEPPAADDLLCNSSHPNLIITPHMAWASAEARRRMVQQLAANVQAFISGQPQHKV
ncbi:D-2-hydroxyacid dehydrogenase [Rheinheimera sp. YQF-2]|uniref:D-2-hydroxyacid dehydrogenase n=1 Tax=Rheinheimera lutimaris TaxID=2740584 RepID=A0A7Y5ARX5_9GAMM|nr:D-2-hydroxyacid dehydrogenase [Rheinheimera lutimaris]NRQ43422.1 D-2-hydroxyacid dehydrogenase [Rheinheimera lutimaris]